MKQTIFKDKSTKNNLSSQVKTELNKKGFSFLFNWEDYKYFKAQAKNAFLFKKFFRQRRILVIFSFFLLKIAFSLPTSFYPTNFLI